MTSGADHQHRRSLRLQGYDYAQAGAYFVTICTQEQACLFGEIVDGQMRLNPAGEMIRRVWTEIPAHVPDVDIDTFVVMPNHIHGIIVLTGFTPVGAGLVPARDDSPNGGKAPTRGAPTVLGNVVGAFKSRVTVEYIRGVKDRAWASFRGRLWQRNYYEHIIRDEASLQGIREYIANNPLQWTLDRENPTNVVVGAGLVPASGDASDGDEWATTRGAPTTWVGT